MKLCALDANSLLNRAFYAIRPLSTKSGEYTNAVYGFLANYFRLVNEVQPRNAELLMLVTPSSSTSGGRFSPATAMKFVCQGSSSRG